MGKKYIPRPSGEGEQEDAVIPVDGNLWMIQCKRESGIGPKKVGDIIDECIPNTTSVPHGFILAASTNFSKESFDKFAEKLKEKGVTEFFLWGKPELESMLVQPKFDRVLFSFFGISLVAKTKSKTSKVKALISVKNKLRTILGDKDPRDNHRSILIKDVNADMYPWTGEYPNFDTQPEWMEVEPYRYYPNGIIVRYKEYFGYLDLANKTWDCIEKIDNFRKESEIYRPSKLDPETEKSSDYWNHLPRKNRVTIYKQGYIRYKDILVIDEKGDLEYDFPHIYVDRNEHNSLFRFQWFAAGLGEFGTEQVIDLMEEEGYFQKNFFPKKIPSIKKGKFHSGKVLEIDPDLIRIFANNSYCRELIALDNKYDYLSPRDIVEYPSLFKDASSSMKEYIMILHKYSTTVEEYLLEKQDGLGKTVLDKQIGENVNEKTKIEILEFKITYYRPEDSDKS